MKILYFGTYNSLWGRSRIYMKGLAELGVEVLECHSGRPGALKYLDLFRNHFKLKDDYDFLVVGYPGHAVVWFARLLSKKKIIFDALCTMEEGVMISRGERGILGIKGLYIKLLDWSAVKFAHTVLVESEAQKKFFETKFGKSNKYKVVYTGADDSVFYPESSVQKRNKFTVLFRGKFLPEAGVRYILQAAKILEDKGIEFLIIGNGWLEKEITHLALELKPDNMEILSKNLPYQELRSKMLECHLSLGQFENHPRLSRTVPHKCFESLALGLPYLTGRSAPILEILQDKESCLTCNLADPDDLAEKILYLKDNPEVRENIARKGYEVYRKSFTPKALASKIVSLLK